MKWLTVFSLAFATAGCVLNGQGIYLDPAEAGQDYRDQGEYRNDWGGAQVIARGNGQFRMVTYRGGLPGAGWNREYKQETSGERQDGKIVFTGPDNYRAELADGTLTITTANGGPWTMKKVERKSPTLGAEPPENAVVLFDGTSADKWAGGEMDDHNLLGAGCKTKQSFNDFKLHLEFRTPFKPRSRGQGRGNSGVYLQDRYEIQVLDSFGLEGRNNECGGFYGQAAPRVNMCFPPLAWQTYDVEFTSAKFDDDGNKTRNAMATVRHNGVVIHEDQELTGPTGGGDDEGPSGGPIQLQGHGNPVFYRNIWVVPQ